MSVALILAALAAFVLGVGWLVEDEFRWAWEHDLLAISACVSAALFFAGGTCAFLAA